MNRYDIKMLKIYYRKIKESFRLLKWNMWQKLNRKFLYTYPIIEDRIRCEKCGRNVHDFIVPNHLWKEVIGNEDKVLCYDCFCNESDKKVQNIEWI